MRRFPSLLPIAIIALSSACGGSPPAPEPDAPRVAEAGALSGQGGRQIRLVGRYSKVQAEMKLGDPARDPGYVLVLVGNRPVRLGLTPRPAEERDRFLDETVEVRGMFQLKAPPPAPGLETNPDLEAMPILMPLVPPELAPAPVTPALPLLTPQ